jgi:hypothetical protein
MFPFEKVPNYIFWTTWAIWLALGLGTVCIFLSMLRRVFGFLNFHELLTAEVYTKDNNDNLTEVMPKIDRRPFQGKIELPIDHDDEKRCLHLIPAGEEEVVIEEDVAISERTGRPKAKWSKKAYLVKGEEEVNREHYSYLFKKAELKNEHEKLGICIKAQNRKPHKRFVKFKITFEQTKTHGNWLCLSKWFHYSQYRRSRVENLGISFIALAAIAMTCEIVFDRKWSNIVFVIALVYVLVKSVKSSSQKLSDYLNQFATIFLGLFKFIISTRKVPAST